MSTEKQVQAALEEIREIARDMADSVAQITPPSMAWYQSQAEQARLMRAERDAILEHAAKLGIKPHHGMPLREVVKDMLEAVRRG